MLTLRQALTILGKEPPIRIPSELPIPSRSLRQFLADTPIEYGITVVTGTLMFSGTDASVYLTLFGERRESIEFDLDNAESNFEGGKTDYFTINSPDVGDIKNIRIRHNNTGDHPGWFLSKIVITNPIAQKEWTFYCNRWLAKDEEDHRIDRILYPTTKCTEYSIGVETGAYDHAGTDANVFVTLLGDRGESAEFWLDDGLLNFEAGYTNYFTIYSRDVGELNSIRIRHDNTGPTPGWFLSKITVKNLTTLKQWTFPCNRWLARDEDDNKIERILYC